jgi:hypothetical protein
MLCLECKDGCNGTIVLSFKLVFLIETLCFLMFDWFLNCPLQIQTGPTPIWLEFLFLRHGIIDFRLCTGFCLSQGRVKAITCFAKGKL